MPLFLNQSPDRFVSLMTLPRRFVCARCGRSGSAGALTELGVPLCDVCYQHPRNPNPHALLATLADETVCQVITHLVDTGTGCWYADPASPGVFGFTFTGAPAANRAIVYLQPLDFELDEAWFAAMAKVLSL